MSTVRSQFRAQAQICMESWPNEFDTMNLQRNGLETRALTSQTRDQHAQMIKKERYRPFTRECRSRILSEEEVDSQYIVFPPLLPFRPPLVFALFSILYYFPSIPTAHVQIQIYGADTCPISPSPKSLRVVLKAGKQGSVSCKTLNALAAAFSQIFPYLSLSFSFLILILFHGVV